MSIVRIFFYFSIIFSAPLPPELLDIPDDLLKRSASDGTIEENFEEELAKAPVVQVYGEVKKNDTIC